MVSFIQPIEELSQERVTLDPAEVRRMRDRFGDKVLQMGHLAEDGSLSVSIDSLLEAIGSVGTRKLHEAAQSLKSEEMVSMLESAEALVDGVAAVEKRKLARMVGQFQSELDADQAHRQWKDIEKMVFGVDYPD